MAVYTITLQYDDKVFSLRFYAQFLITMRENDTKTMYTSMCPVRDVIDRVSTGRLIGYFFERNAWIEGKHAPKYVKTLERFEDLTFQIKSIVPKPISKDTDLPIGPAPVGLAEITFEFRWKEDGCLHIASQVISFQTITSEQFSADF